MTDTITGTSTYRTTANGNGHSQVDPATARLLRALGWASVGLAVPQLTRPAEVTRAVGVGDGDKQRAIAKAVGARELLHAAGLLSPRLHPRWVWTRVAGDAMDLAALGNALNNHRGRGRSRTAAATAAVAAITVVDVYAALRSSRIRKDQPMELTAVTTVRRSPAEVYAFWRRPAELPTFLAHLEDVHTEIVTDVPGVELAWRSAEGSAIANEGRVHFVEAPGGRGTEVQVRLTYSIPGGRLGEAVARFFGEDPHQQLDDDLRRFKQVMETGEVVRSEGAPWGKRARKEFPQHPARPLTDKELAELLRDPQGVSA